MRREKAIEPKAVTGVASSDSEKRHASVQIEDSGIAPEEAVLIVAEESVSPAEYRGILTPELRLRLDAMTRDYARILTRIDRLEAQSREERNDREQRRRDNAS